MIRKYLLAMLAILVATVACDREADRLAAQTPEPEPETVVKAADDSGMYMRLPYSTESEEAGRLYLAGWAATEMGHNQEANEFFERAVAADPEFAMGHLMVALTANSTEEFSSNLATAAEHGAGATEGERTLIEAFQKGFANDQQGQLAAGEALVKMHPDSPRAWQLLAGFQSNQNDTTSSRASLEKALSLDPNLASTHMQLGNDYLFLEPKDFEKAAAHFQKAVELEPDEPNTHDLLGDAHRALGDMQAAYDDYTRAAELVPHLGSPLQQRGHVNSFLGNYEEARADYTRSAELEDLRGSNNGPFFLVFRSYVSLHEGKPQAAIAELKQLAAESDGWDMEGKLDFKVNAYNNIAQIATHQGDADAAAAAIAEAAKMMRQRADQVGTAEYRSAQEANISYLEGMLAARTGDPEGAKAKAAEFEQHVASNTNPRKHERMHEILGMAAFYQADYAAAVEHLAQGDVVNNALTKYHLAVANDKAGNGAEAEKLFAELAVLNFNSAGYAMTRSDILARTASG